MFFAADFDCVRVSRDTSILLNEAEGHALFYYTLMKKLKTRQQLEDYIRKHIPFYKSVDLRGHNEEQLRGVIERNERKKRDEKNL